MSIVSITTDVAGQINVNPRRVKIITTDNNTTIVAAGYLNAANLMGYNIVPTDVFDIIYSYSKSTNSGTYDVYTCTIANNGIITLIPDVTAGNVVLPVVNGDFAIFSGTTGLIADLGYLPSDASKTKVVMANGAVILNHIGTFKDTAGTLGNDAATAINGGSIQAGLSGTAGQFTSFPATAANGSFVFKAINNSNNFASTLSNSAVAQASVYTLPDPATATANVLVAPSSLVNGNLVKASGTAGLIVDQGVAMKSVAQAAVAGGAAAQSVTDSFCTSASCVVCTWNDTSNAVSIQKAVAGNGSFVVTSSGDPGASHLNYIITK